MNPALLVVLAFAAVGAVVFLVVSLGGGGSQQALPPVSAPAASPAAGASPSPAVSPPASPAPSAPSQTFEVFESKDPFRPLVVPPVEGTGGAGGAPAVTLSPTAGAGAAGAPAPAGGQPVELVDVVDEQGTPKAQVRVGTTVHTVAAGETFATTFKVLSIEDTCATMLNGDDKFTLCKGEQVLK